MSLFTLTEPILSKRKARNVQSATALLVACAALLGFTACQERVLRPNLILVALERTRVDHFSSYGEDPRDMRVYSYVTRRGLRFDNAYTSATDAREATIDLLSGGNSATDGPLLPELLQRDGYVTIGSLNERGANESRLKAGFDELDDAGGTPEERCDRLFKLVATHILDEKPIYVFYQASVIEAPYRGAADRTAGGEIKPPDVDFESLQESLGSGKEIEETEAAQLAELYAMEVDRAHGALARMMAPLRGWGFYERYLTVITALAGEELGERGRYSPEDSLYDEVLHVPLIMASDGMVEGAVRPELVTIEDIAPTMLGYAAVAAVPELPGRDLLGSGQAPREAVRSRAADARVVRTAKWKLIDRADGESVELYNLVDDPREQTNVAAENPDVVERLRAR